jgi:hypothetical protein
VLLTEQGPVGPCSVTVEVNAVAEPSRQRLVLQSSRQDREEKKQMRKTGSMYSRCSQGQDMAEPTRQHLVLCGQRRQLKQ